MRSTLTFSIALFLSTSAAVASDPGDVRLGAELGVFGDMADRTSRAHTRFAGGSLTVPVRIQLTPGARLRAAVGADLGPGRDRVTWTEDISGQPTVLYSDDHFAMLASARATVGAEVVFPTNSPLELFLGFDVGVGWFGTYHSFSGPTAILLDPDQNDLEDPGNIDPFTSQLAPMTGVDLGFSLPFGEGLHLTVRTGYSGAFLGSRPLSKSPEELGAERNAYGFNPLRFGVALERTF